MTAQILSFPTKARRVLLFDEAAEQYQDVRTRFASMFVKDSDRPAWLRFLSDHQDVERGR